MRTRKAIFAFFRKNKTQTKKQLIEREWVEPCEACNGKEDDKFFHHRSKKRNGDPVSLKMIERMLDESERNTTELQVGLTQNPVELARKVPKSSTLLIGDTGKFKTLVMEFWFNKLLHNDIGQHEKFIWLTENEIFEQARENECKNLYKRLQKKKIIFIDEMFYFSNWQGSESEEKINHYRRLEYTGMNKITEYFYQNQESLLIIGSTNYKPENIMEAEKLIPSRRRFHDIFGKGAGRIEL